MGAAQTVDAAVSAASDDAAARGATMDRILWEVSYSREGVRRLLNELRARRTQVAEFFAASGGHLEAMYVSFEDGSAYLIGDLPGGVSARVPEALLAGAMQVKSVVLMTPEEAALTAAC